ncbi:MAG: hypothetical protein ACI9XO_003479 [Paraglaciecola sp.]|jgi:hypothetical protein
MIFNNLKFLSLALVTIFAVALTSCDKEAASVETAENFVDTAIRSMQHGAVGKKGCLEFIFPITVQFSDETTATANDYPELFTAIKGWFEANGGQPNFQNRPSLVFPVQVINTDAEIIEVNNKEELIALKVECQGQFNGPGNCQNGHGHSCFSIVFPVTVTLGDDTVTFDDKPALRAGIQAYRQAAGPGAERPQLAFPITIEYEDGTQVVINSKEELMTAKEDCGNE